VSKGLRRENRRSFYIRRGTAFYILEGVQTCVEGEKAWTCGTWLPTHLKKSMDEGRERKKEEEELYPRCERDRFTSTFFPHARHSNAFKTSCEPLNMFELCEYDGVATHKDGRTL
jgi:hypothetical protein